MGTLGFRLRTTTIRKVTVSHQGLSNSQICCLIGGTRCSNKKEAILSKKKLRFRPKNVKGRGFSDFQVCTRMRRTYTVWSLICSNWQNSREIENRKCSEKNWSFWKNIFRFWPKKVKKCFFFRFFRSALKRFGTWLCDTNDAQAHKTTVEVDWKRVATVRVGSLRENVAFRSKKRSKIGFFWGFQCLH